jgi:uncharacterized protein YqeY
VSLKQKLLDDMKSAMKDKDIIRKNVVQMIRAAVLQVEKDNKTELDDNAVIDVISRELKKRRDVLPEYEKSGRQELVENLEAEIDILLGYLPEQLNPEQIEEIVRDAVKSTGAVSMKDIGKVMQIVMPKVAGRADGKQVNLIVRKVLE